MNKFNGWESDIDSNGQPILPKQVICVTNNFSDVESDPFWVGKKTDFEVGKVYDVLPYPYDLSPSEVTAAKSKSGLLFMAPTNPKYKMNSYISKKYFIPVEKFYGETTWNWNKQ